MSHETPLRGTRVLECGGWNTVLAGRLLADAGAEVVRVVPPDGDLLALEPPFFPGSGDSIQAAWYNAGKTLIALDLESAEDRARLLELLGGCDILLDEWLPGAGPVGDDQFGAPSGPLVRVSVTPFGAAGPWAGLRTSDLVANALCGSASVTGDHATPPLTGYGNQSHHTVGFYTAICALSALRAARASGAHQHVDLSAHEALVTCTEQVLMQWFFPEAGNWTTAVAERLGSSHWSKAYEVYPGSTETGIMVTASLRLVDVLVPWLAEGGFAQDLVDPAKYPDAISLVRDLPNVMRVLREWVEKHDAEELFYEAQRRHLPFGVVWDIATALKSPQMKARGYFQDQPVAGGASYPFPGRFFKTDADGAHPGPPLSARAGDIGWEPRPAVPARHAVQSSRPLEGVRVMDFTHVLAGPFGTRVLGDLGAEVLKVGSATRGAGANSTGHPYYMMWNRNKRSVSLNMSTDEGRELARRLAGECDIIIENFRAGVLTGWGLDRASLAEVNPGVSVITMGGVGQTGPWKDFVTFAPTIHALVGLTYLTGVPGRHDIGYGFSLNDHLSGLAGAMAALEAIQHRDRTGNGLEIDLSQYEVGLGLMAPAYLDYFANGRNPEPVGNAHPFGAWAPHGIYPAAGDDRWVAVAIRGDDEWARLCAEMGQPALATAPRFRAHADRLAHAEELDALISGWTAGQDRYRIMERLQAAGIAAGAVQDGRDLAENDPQLQASGFFSTANSERWGDYAIDQFPATFNGERPGRYDATQEAGADTFDVLKDVLRLTDDQIAELAGANALL